MNELSADTKPRFTAKQWLKVIDEHRDDARDGLWLEELVDDIGHQIPEWDFQDVVHWDEWEDRLKLFPGAKGDDIGIDNVGIRADGSFVAIQCKARKFGGRVTKEDARDFLSAAQSHHWVERWIVSNGEYSDGIAQLQKMDPDRPIKFIDFVNPVRQLARQEDHPVREDAALTEMQDDAVESIVRLLREHQSAGRAGWNKGEARGHIVMPCGTGKTRVCYRVMKELVKPNEIAVVLVPSIALVSQIKSDFQALARRDGIPIRTLAVCSDITAGQSRRDEDRVNIEKDRTVDTGFIGVCEVAGETALNGDQVRDWLSTHVGTENRVILFSTYQSAHNTAYGLLSLKMKAKLMIGDEAHRTAGIRKASASQDGMNERIRNFTLCHDKDKFPATFRLYQTATPRIYAKQYRDEMDPSKWEVRSMNDEATFGYELFRLQYSDAVEQNLLSDYRIIAWGLGDEESEAAQKVAEELNKQALEQDETPRWNTTRALRALGLASFLAGVLPKVSVRSVIAFCNRIKISSDLTAAINSNAVKSWLKTYIEGQDPRSYQVTHIDASHRINVRNEALNGLAIASEDAPFCISNVGIFGEGTDSPDLSAVAFLQPRKSPVDVVQAVGRVMRKSERKSLGYIFVPVIIPPHENAEHFLRHSTSEDGWQELGQILQALRAHDARIETKLADLMEIWLPSQSTESREHLLIVKEPRKRSRVFIKKTRANIENIVAQSGENDQRTVEERLKESPGELEEVEDVGDLSRRNPPYTTNAVRTKRNGTTMIGGVHYVAPKGGEIELGAGVHVEWDANATVASAKKMIDDDVRGKKTTMVEAERKQKRTETKANKDELLGDRLVSLGGDKLKESGILLNLLEKSGIMSGPKRDMNIIQVSVEAISKHLRDEGLERMLAKELDMVRVDRGKSGTADACTVTAIIWMNSAIMHARLDESSLAILSGARKLEKMIADPTPARGIADAWQKILTKDYIPIFEVALELLMAVAFENRVGVSEALRRMAKDAVAIADEYAEMGMDFAGELFNKVMGNQRSDGAFFTRPSSASMLAELVLHATGETQWQDESTWQRLKCFDPACGSGTLLVAMISAIKRRIRQQAGLGKEEMDNLLSKFHTFAVEQLMMGADINPVSLQLAGCQMTVGNVGVYYERLNLWKMDYGLTNETRISVNSVRTGTPELLVDPRIVEVSDEEIELDHRESSGTNLELYSERNLEQNPLIDELVNTPPRIILMNPPYTPWKDIGSKFDTPLQKELRNRLAAIWDVATESESILNQKKTSIAPLFETLATKLAARTDGIVALVRPLVFMTMASARKARSTMARTMHIDFILSSHDPSNINMSWDTSINECLIVASSSSSVEELSEPTKFINLDRMPSTDNAHDVISAALSGSEFEGSITEWEYERMLEGDWIPAAFRDTNLANLTKVACSQTDKLYYDWESGGYGKLQDSIFRGNAKFKVDHEGADWRMTGTKRYEHFDRPVDGSEPVISGTGMNGQLFLEGTINKWVRLSRLEGERKKEYDIRLALDKQGIQKFRSHLLLSKGFDTSASRLTAVVASKPKIGYSWMPVTGEIPLELDTAKALAVWFNSSLGRSLLRTVCGRKLAYPMYNPDSWHRLPYPDVTNESTKATLKRCFDKTSVNEVPSFREGRVEIREIWDDAVASSLGIDRSLIAELADGLACEPTVSRESFFEIV